MVLPVGYLLAVQLARRQIVFIIVDVIIIKTLCNLFNPTSSHEITHCRKITSPFITAFRFKTTFGRAKMYAAQMSCSIVVRAILLSGAALLTLSEEFFIGRGINSDPNCPDFCMGPLPMTIQLVFPPEAIWTLFTVWAIDPCTGRTVQGALVTSIGGLGDLPAAYVRFEPV